MEKVYEIISLTTSISVILSVIYLYSWKGDNFIYRNYLNNNKYLDWITRFFVLLFLYICSTSLYQLIISCKDIEEEEDKTLYILSILNFIFLGFFVYFQSYLVLYFLFALIQSGFIIKNLTT